MKLSSATISKVIPGYSARNRTAINGNEELLKDRAAGGAQRFADADLSGSFGDRDQHDVQDSDTADDQ